MQATKRARKLGELFRLGLNHHKWELRTIAGLRLTVSVTHRVRSWFSRTATKREVRRSLVDVIQELQVGYFPATLMIMTRTYLLPSLVALCLFSAACDPIVPSEGAAASVSWVVASSVTPPTSNTISVFVGQLVALYFSSRGRISPVVWSSSSPAL